MTRTPAVRLADAVWRIPTTRFDLINSYAFVEDDGQVTLVDCGLKRAPARIVAGLAAIGKHPADVTRILLTHAHADHAGGAAQLMGRTTADHVRAHEDDVADLEAGVSAPLDTSTTAGRLMARLPRQRFAAVPVGEPLRDGQVLEVAGRLRVVHTPGHTPGHVSLLHESSGVLVTGDSIFNVRGLRWPFRPVCTDFAQSRRTAARLADLDYALAAFTHGPEIRDGAREAVRRFINS